MEIITPMDERPWSISSGPVSSTPRLTSSLCYDALVQLFQNESSLVLSVAAESSSHVSGVSSLYAQPWVYAGGGLGNIDECPLQVCLAGGTKRDSLTFASACVVPECDANDLHAPDFTARLEQASFQADTPQDQDIRQEYVNLHKRIAQVNHLLNTGWVCGEYKVAWEVLPSTIYILVLFGCLGFSIYSTFYRHQTTTTTTRTLNTAHYVQCASTSSALDDDDEEEEKKDSGWNECFEMKACLVEMSQDVNVINRTSNSFLEDPSFWDAWDMRKNLKKLTIQRPDTACLDGLKVGSILWVILGHTLAIQSSTGPGYLNPASFLPPVGITTTFIGQLLFSSRFAVDTFLSISGYLVVHILKNRLQTPTYSRVGSIMIFRILRILPMYLICLGFWILIAPHLGSGPFWYQWENFLEPCRQYWWTNVLFVNNFWPWGQSTTDTCFYHSWYLAVDVQLFFLLAPWLVILYNKYPVLGRQVTLWVWILSAAATAVLAYERNWSVNTFDGMAVALFDVEGYAKPHVRAQSYLAGMYVAMLPPSKQQRPYDIWVMALALFLLAFSSFITLTGAYSRRACNFEEWPDLDHCGSLWSLTTTFVYTAFCRAIWSMSIATIIYLCVQSRGFAVGRVLGWRLWTPLAHLSFGVYLIHPVIIFAWKLGGKEKTTFGLFSFLMNFTSVSIVSFVLSAVLILVIEFPFAELLHPKRAARAFTGSQHDTETTTTTSTPVYQYSSGYGSVVSARPNQVEL